MEDVTGVVEVLMFKEVLLGETTLLIIASLIDQGQWQLSVQNEGGVNSTWLEFFPSARLAIDAGMAAIEKEGVEPFLDFEGDADIFLET